MGERLVFSVIKNDEQIATIYYHWSAYTRAIYEEARVLINGLRSRGYFGVVLESASKEEIQKVLLQILEEDSKYHFEAPDGTVVDNHGGCSGTSVKHDDGSKTYPEKEAFEALGVEVSLDDVSRNCGLIDITEEGMANAKYLAEDIEEFNLDNETFTNNLFYQYEEDIEEVWEDVSYDDIPEVELPQDLIDVISFDDVDKALKWYISLEFYKGYYIIGKDKFGTVWEVVE